MAYSSIYDYRDAPLDAQHHAGRNEVLKPSIPNNDDLYRPDGWPSNTFAERRTLADHVVREYATLRKLRPNTRSKSLLASHRKALAGLAAYQDKIRKMEASGRSVNTKAEETVREEGMSPPPPNLSADPELPSRSQSVTSLADELESPQIQTSDGIAKLPSALKQESLRSAKFY